MISSDICVQLNAYDTRGYLANEQIACADKHVFLGFFRTTTHNFISVHSTADFATFGLGPVIIMQLFFTSIMPNAMRFYRF